MAVISMKQFLDAGVHFGHQTKRWHPKMSPYIYGTKNGVHVIDLRQTLIKLKEAYEYVKASAEQGRVPLFVGTKTQVQAIVKEEADRCGCPYINFRWLGGLLTNFGTVKQSIARMKSFEEMAGEDGSYDGFIKKEALMMERKRLKLERSLGGVRNMNNIPAILFITDCHREQLALKEAQKLGIPVVGVSDTNCDPTGIDFVIPGNDDSPRAVALYSNVISAAVIEGLANRNSRLIIEASEKKIHEKKEKIVAKEKKGEVKEINPEKDKKKTKGNAKKSLQTDKKIVDKDNNKLGGEKSLQTESDGLLKSKTPINKESSSEKILTQTEVFSENNKSTKEVKPSKKKTLSAEKKSSKEDKSAINQKEPSSKTTKHLVQEKTKEKKVSISSVEKDKTSKSVNLSKNNKT